MIVIKCKAVYQDSAILITFEDNKTCLIENSLEQLVFLNECGGGDVDDVDECPKAYYEFAE